MKTFAQKPADVSRAWYHVDAAGLPVGRIAVAVAKLLAGKAKPTFTPHVDGGDFVVITNAAQITLSGGKLSEAVHHYSGFPGGLRTTTHAKLLQTNPTKLVQLAVAGMIPENKLKPARLARLKIYTGGDHEHSAQQPKTVEVKL